MTIMNRSRMRALLAVFAACVVGALAMAGSAFAETPSWHVEGKPFTGTEYPTVDTATSKFTISVPGLASTITCQTRKAGEKGLYGSAATVTESTHAWFYFVLTSCTVEHAGAPEPKCVTTNTPELTFNGLGSVGTATELHSYGSTKVEFQKEKGCFLPSSATLTVPNVTNSYGEEHVSLKVNTSGAATYGAQAATFSGQSFWSLYKSPLWGWY